MGKDRGSARKGIGGPYLDAAFLCDQVLQDKDGTYSVIRLVNRINFWGVTSEPERNTLLVVPLMAVVSFKAGDIREKRDLYLYQTSPSGNRVILPGFEFPISMPFEGGDTGVFLPFRSLLLRYEGEGTYWIDVVLSKKRYSRIPLTLALKKEPSPERPG